MNHTYQELDAELYNKGHGGIMMSRRVAKNTRLERLSNANIGLRYHDTVVVTWTPDGRLILRMNGWNTASTRQRINAWIDKPFGVRSIHDRPYVTARLRLPQTTHRVGRYGQMIESSDTETWTTILVPFQDGMAFDLASGELVADPDADPITLAYDFDRVVRRSERLRPVVNELARRRNESITTHNDIDYAVRLYERWKTQREQVADAIRDLDTRLTWEQTMFEEELAATMTEYSKRLYPKREAREEVKGQVRASELIAPLVLDN